MAFLLLPHLSSFLIDSLPSLNFLCHSKTDARFMQDSPKTVWNIHTFRWHVFPSIKQHFIVYRYSKVSSRLDCLFEIHQLWQSGFSWVYSDSCCSCSFQPEIVRIDQSSHKMYRNNIYIYNNTHKYTLLNTNEYIHHRLFFYDFYIYMFIEICFWLYSNIIDKTMSLFVFFIWNYSFLNILKSHVFFS